MYCTKKITSDLIWLGGSDRRLALFENVYPIPRGVSYNAYLIQDEKTALLDTVDQAIAERFFENLEHALQGKPLNYVIVNHMEPDHAATLGTVLSRYPEATVIGNAKTLPMIKQFFPMEVEGRFQAVKEGDTLSLGIYNAGNLFDNLIKITAFFCNQRRVCGNATDNTHIIRFTDLINIRGINKKFHFSYPPNFYKIDSQYLLYLLYISIPYLSHLFPYLNLYFTNCYCSRIRAQ